jgi:hypothetical protein
MQFSVNLCYQFYSKLTKNENGSSEEAVNSLFVDA